MKSVPYIMLLASKIQAVGAFNAYRLKTSITTKSMSATMSHAKVFPTHVLISSAVCSKVCVFI